MFHSAADSHKLSAQLTQTPLLLAPGSLAHLLMVHCLLWELFPYALLIVCA